MTNFFEASDNVKTWIGGVDNSLAYVKEGTLSNHDLAIVTANSPKVYIQTDGNVGIGTTNPGAKLDVNGPIRTPGLYLGDTVPAEGIHKGQIFTDSSNAVNIYAYDAGGIVFRAAGGGSSPSEQMRILPSGNVYIGKTSGVSRFGISGLPTSAAGLSSEDVYIYNDGTRKYLCII